MVEVVKEVEEIDVKKIALMDLEGTLTPGNRSIHENPDPEHMRRILNGEKLEGEQEVGYWSGIHLLGGETPGKYFERVEEWKDGEVTVDEFENENLRQWNSLLEESEFGTAENFIDWYNEKFLDLREKSQQLVDICHERGYLVGIISHTSTGLSKHAAEYLDVEYVIPSWTFKFEDGKFVRTEMRKYAEDKSHIVDQLRDAGTEHIIFYGNAENDIEIANRADEAYMVENREEVDYMNLNAFTGSFEQVLEHFQDSEVYD
jgi:phosphoserine phosphatase